MFGDRQKINPHSEEELNTSGSTALDCFTSDRRQDLSLVWIIFCCWLTLIPVLSSRSNRGPYLPSLRVSWGADSWVFGAAYDQHSPSSALSAPRSVGVHHTPRPFSLCLTICHPDCVFVWALLQFIACFAVFLLLLTKKKKTLKRSRLLSVPAFGSLLSSTDVASLVGVAGWGQKCALSHL